MAANSPARTLDVGIADTKADLFIVSELPFVCQNIPSIIPFVCIYNPSVGIAKNNQGIRGFTLIELMITLVIAGILVALAGPAMRSFVQDQRLTGQANEFVGDLNYARSEAIKRASNAGVCASSDGASCGGTWQNGWIVFVDTDNSRTWTTGDSVLRVHESITSDVAINSSASIAVFSASGLLDSGTGTGDYTLCSSQLGKSRTINITSTGRPSMSSGTC